MVDNPPHYHTHAHAHTHTQLKYVFCVHPSLPSSGSSELCGRAEYDGSSVKLPSGGTYYASLHSHHVTFHPLSHTPP